MHCFFPLSAILPYLTVAIVSGNKYDNPTPKVHAQRALTKYIAPLKRPPPPPYLPRLLTLIIVPLEHPCVGKLLCDVVLTKLMGMI